MTAPHSQPWLKQITPGDVLKAVVFLIAIGIAWGNVNARLVAIEGEAPERKEARQKIGDMSTSIGILEERSKNQEVSLRSIERLLRNGRD